MKLRRVLYILYRIAHDLVSLFSRALNAFVLGGSTAQTTSSRVHIEARKSKAWARAKWVINSIFFWQEDHCRSAWEADVDRARYTISLLTAETNSLDTR
jgi:hypothetical protein